jgi:GNAT superfamily N-acetyltransferase
MAISIRAAAESDTPCLADIERAAGLLFLDVGMPEIAHDDPPPDEVLREGVAAGCLWVAFEDAEPQRPVAYLLAMRLAGSVHIEQLTVHPDFARQRIGARLIDACAAWANTQGYQSLTLTTFRDVPWNAPYYRRLGFAEVTDLALPDDVREIVRGENDAGLDRWPRVVMRRELAWGG